MVTVKEAGQVVVYLVDGPKNDLIAAAIIGKNIDSEGNHALNLYDSEDDDCPWKIIDGDLNWLRRFARHWAGLFQHGAMPNQEGEVWID